MSIFESKMNGGLGKGTRGVLRKKNMVGYDNAYATYK